MAGTCLGIVPTAEEVRLLVVMLGALVGTDCHMVAVNFRAVAATAAGAAATAAAAAAAALADVVAVEASAAAESCG